MICTSEQDIEGMKKANIIVRDALLYAETLIKPGISTYELDKRWLYYNAFIEGRWETGDSVSVEFVLRK